MPQAYPPTSSDLWEGHLQLYLHDKVKKIPYIHLNVLRKKLHSSQEALGYEGTS